MNLKIYPYIAKEKLARIEIISNKLKNKEYKRKQDIARYTNELNMLIENKEALEKIASKYNPNLAKNKGRKLINGKLI